ncbi:MAG: TonB-dependent receptor [Altererythrobacter sp.]|nr:TonB-dependent receptor [Altererythrobacter sp.]
MKLKYFLAASVATIGTAVALPAPVIAQSITSGIEGRVTDETGTPLPGATVIVTDTRTGTSRTLTTNSEGGFNATNLTVGGPYSVAASASGFEGQTVADISITLQGNTSLTFTLAQGGGEIVVTGSRVRLTELAVGPGQSFTAEVLENAPTFNRDVRDIIRIDPRVSLDRDDGGSGQDRISCLGGNDRGNAFTVDGIAQGDVFGLNDTGFSSRSSTPIPYDAIRETQVQFAPFDVEYGQFTGCAINVVTKSGGNQLRGGAFFEYSDSGMRGNTLDNRGTLINVQPIKPDKRWGVNLGGAIIPDRLFVFGAYERQESGLSQDEGPSGAGYANEMNGVSATQFNEITDVLRSQYGIDSGPLVTSRPYKNERYFVRADLQINDRHRLEATYQNLKETTLKADDLFTGNSPQAVGQNTFYLSGTDSEYYSGRLYSNWTDAFSTELRYARTSVQDIQDPFGGGEAQLGNPVPRIIVGIDNATGNDGAVEVGPGRSRTANDLRTKISYFRAVAKLQAGNHSFKLGAEANLADLYNVFIQDATGTLVFRNITDLRNGLLSPGLGNNQTSTTPANIVSGQTEGAFGNFSPTGDANDGAAIFKRNIYSVYAQDDWQVTDRLKVVLGVRADWYDGGAPPANPNFFTRYGFSNANGFSKIDPLVMPRLGLTYDLGDFAVFSRTKLHGGVGVFSGGDPLVWFSNAFSNTGGNIALANTQATGCATGQIKVTDASGKFTGIPQCIVTAASAAAAQFRGNTQSIDPNIQTPSVLRANFGLTTELNLTNGGFLSGWNITTDFIWSKYRNPYNVVDLAQAVYPLAGLNGYTIDGRPIYRGIDTSNAGCTAKLTSASPVPTYSNFTAACLTTSRGAEIMLTNADSYDSKVASFLLSKNFGGGIFTPGGSVFFSAGYAFTDSNDRRNMYNSTATSNYGQSAAFDRQNPAASRGFFESRHNITVNMSFTEKFFGDYRTRFGVTYVGRAGRPYSLTFTGNGVFNPTSGGLTTNDGALLYLPTGLNAVDPNVSPLSTITAAQMTTLVDFLGKLECAKGYLGRSIDRNTCTNDWYNDLDLSFSQELPGPGRLFGRDDRIRLFVTMDNFLNFLDNGLNINHRRNFFGVQDLAQVSGVDAQGRYIFSNANALNPNAAGLTTFDTDNGVNVSSSVWRLKVGVSYNF